MSSLGQIPLKDVWAMLAQCAPGHTIDTHTHHYWIRYNGRLYPTFPKGEHGKTNPPIQRGHVKRMARFLDILDCAKEHLSL
jgi:hypothetical protein